MPLPRITFGTVVKLVIASLVVGVVLAVLDISPGEIAEWARTALGDVFSNASGYVQSGLSYVLLGAVVVVPIWLIHYVWRALRRKG